MIDGNSFFELLRQSLHLVYSSALFNVTSANKRGNVEGLDDEQFLLCQTVVHMLSLSLRIPACRSRPQVFHNFIPPFSGPEETSVEVQTKSQVIECSCRVSGNRVQ